MTTTIVPEELAVEFCRILNEWLSADELDEINRRNGLPEYETCCATHDFCDPNQAMAEALETFGVEFHSDRCDFINDAWAIAKAGSFQLHR